MADGASAKSLPKGVRIRAGAIQIYFERNKQAYNITLPHPPTAEGISAAAKIRSQLITKAEWGILTDKDIAEAKGEKVDKMHLILNSNEVLFQEIAQKYLRQCEANLDSRKGYTRILNCHWMPHFALRPINQITNDEIRDLIIDKNFKTAKTLNNSLIPLRGVFEVAMNSKVILDNPMHGIENKRIQQAIPDPFSRDEMNALLKWLDKNLEGKNRLYYWFYELAFWCGCRPSELFALRWNDIDWFNGTMRISKSRVRGYEKSVTKTHTVRDVYLNDRSKRALTEIQKLGLSRDYVMICPETGLPFYDERPPRFRLNDAMKACKIRHRPAYNTRHTYATMLLMDGVNPVFVADQMGHSLQMLMKRYAKWMHGDKNKIEMAKLNTS